MSCDRNENSKGAFFSLDLKVKVLLQKKSKNLLYWNSYGDSIPRDMDFTGTGCGQFITKGACPFL